MGDHPYDRSRCGLGELSIWIEHPGALLVHSRNLLR